MREEDKKLEEELKMCVSGVICNLRNRNNEETEREREKSEKKKQADTDTRQ